ncbi:MAG TPA: xylulokinase, partial [Actinokineospora sp.]|nr:xylulokinase [Actinokineospora sp.]
MSARRVVAGVDSSTQSCKVVVCDADTGHVLAEASAPHPDGTEVDPEHWWAALNRATDGGLLDGVDAVAVGGQQHGLVALDDQGAVVRDSLLWNDLRSAPDTADLIAELGARAWAEGTGSVPAASFTVTKLRWLRRCEPANADRTASVMLPHDWLSWRLAGSPAGEWATDRGDASGTGYFSPATGEYRLDLLERALGHRPALPRVAGPSEIIGSTSGGTPLAAGTGDNMAAALGLGVGVGDVVVSLGTSGVVSAVTDVPVADPSGVVAGFADAAGGFLPLVCTLNAARVLVSTAALLGVDLDELSRLALTAEAGAGGVTMLPYLEGERTPPLPDATGSLFGLTGASMNPANIARAAVEGMLCGLAEGLGTLESLGVKARRIVLIGGAARSEAVRAIAPGVFGLPVSV